MNTIDKEIENVFLDDKNANKTLVKSFDEMITAIKKSYEIIKCIPKNTDKKLVEEELKKQGFSEKYKIGELNELLSKGIDDNDVIMTRGNLAYIISRHANDFKNVSVWENMQNVLNDYDIALKGKTGDIGDFVLYKLFDGMENYGIEMKMNKRKDYEGEYIVHYVMISDKTNRATNKLLKLLQSSDVIDSK